MNNLLLLLVLIIFLTACSANTPTVFSNDEFTITVPGNWREDNVNDPSFIKGYFLENNAIAHVYEIDFKEEESPDNLNQETCVEVLDLWLTTFKYSLDSVEDQETEYVKAEGNPDPFCMISYNLRPEGVETTDYVQFEELKVYLEDDIVIIGHFIQSDEENTSTYSGAITDIADSFLLK